MRRWTSVRASHLPDEADLAVCGGKSLANHVGTRLLADLADVHGLTAAVSVAMVPTRQRRSGQDRGEVRVDLAVMIADGGETISQLAVLRDQPELFGTVVSHPTAWPILEVVNDAALERIKTAQAQARAAAWAAGADPGHSPYRRGAVRARRRRPTSTARRTRPPTAPTWALAQRSRRTPRRTATRR